METLYKSYSEFQWGLVLTFFSLPWTFCKDMVMSTRLFWVEYFPVCGTDLQMDLFQN